MAFTFSKKKKYGNQPIKIDNINFDSQREANCYCELKMLKMAGEIADIELQVPFELIPKFNYKGKTIRAVKYIADFLVTYTDGHKQIIEVKGFKTKDYIIKKKLLLSQHPDIDFKEV